MTDRLPCPACSSATLDGRPHARCLDPTCSCDCRGGALDLTDPEARLQVAQLLRDVARRSFVGGDEAATAAGCYVDDLVHAFARRKMRELMGLAEDAGVPPLSGDEVEAVRELLAADRLAPDEVVDVRGALPVVTRVGPLLTELQQQIQALAEVPRPPRPAPAPAPAPAPPRPRDEDGSPRPPPVPNPGPRGRVVPAIPMPRGQALTLATAQDAGRASLLVERRGFGDGGSQADGGGVTSE